MKRSLWFQTWKVSWHIDEDVADYSAEEGSKRLQEIQINPIFNSKISIQVNN